MPALTPTHSFTVIGHIFDQCNTPITKCQSNQIIKNQKTKYHERNPK